MTLRVSGPLNFVPQMILLPHPSPTPIIIPLLPFPSSSSGCVLLGYQGSDLKILLWKPYVLVCRKQSSNSFRKSVKQIAYISRKKKVELVALVFQLVVGPFKGKSKLYVG